MTASKPAAGQPVELLAVGRDRLDVGQARPRRRPWRRTSGSSGRCRWRRRGRRRRPGGRRRASARRRRRRRRAPRPAGRRRPPSSIRLGGLAEPGLQRRAPAVPGLGGVLPLLAGGRLVLHRVEAHGCPPRGRGAHPGGRQIRAGRPEDPIWRFARRQERPDPARCRPWTQRAGLGCSGGDDALARVARAVDAARSGTGHTVLVSGERGHGQDGAAARRRSTGIDDAGPRAGAPASRAAASRATGRGPRRSTGWSGGRRGPRSRGGRRSDPPAGIDRPGARDGRSVPAA